MNLWNWISVAGVIVAVLGILGAVIAWRARRTHLDYNVTDASAWTVAGPSTATSESGLAWAVHDHRGRIIGDVIAERANASGVILDMKGQPMNPQPPTTGVVFYGGENGINVSYPDNVVRRNSDDR